MFASLTPLIESAVKPLPLGMGSVNSDFRQENTQIPWSEIAGYDILAYNRNEPEFDTLWRIASEDMPKLRAFCEQKLKERNVPFPEPESLEEAPSPSEG